MNDRFKFRAKRLDNNKFVYGYLCFIYVDNEKHCKIYSPDEVMSYDCYTETLGQCTGLKDKNGKLIYEGDILEVKVYDWKDKDYAHRYDNKINTLWVVEYKNYSTQSGFMVFGKNRRFHKPLTISSLFNADAVIIGNIHNNADLLEVNND